MSIITPTITTDDAHEYRTQMELIQTYSEGVHLDFADGEFAPTKLLPISQGWRSDSLVTHAHIMYRKPADVLSDIMKLDADLVILHAESENVKECLEKLQANGTRTGVALLPETDVASLQELKENDLFDHILVFGGHLGYQGGEADLAQLQKVKELKKQYPDIEISWDGGVNVQNAKQIADAGVDNLNVGSFLRGSEDAKKAYDLLVSLVQS